MTTVYLVNVRDSMNGNKDYTVWSLYELRRLQCVIAIAKASEESWFFGLQPGRRKFNIVSTCFLSALPTPVRAFLILLGSYSNKGML